MKVNVVSKYKGKGFRTVEIPEDEVNEETTLEETLDLVYRYGQNEFQPRDYPSVSSGDVIVVNQEFYIVESFGFKKIPETLFMKLRKKYEKMEAELSFNLIYAEINKLYKENNISAS